MKADIGVNRRQMIQGLGATLGVLALRGFTVHAAADAHFTHGIASGDPLADRVIVWTRVLPGDGSATAIDCQWQVSEDEAFGRVVSAGSYQATADHDFTVKVDEKGLLREYINNINNTGKLNAYVSEEISKLVGGLKEVGSKITDKVTKIKLAETISNIRKIKSAKRVKEEHLSAMMMTYELLGELKNGLNK